MEHQKELLAVHQKAVALVVHQAILEHLEVKAMDMDIVQIHLQHLKHLI
jgi:hypothetical protein